VSGIVVLSTDPTVAWISDALEAHGFSIREFRFPRTDAGRRDLQRRLENAPPDAIVYDLDAPSAARVNAFWHVRLLPGLRDLPSLICTSESEVLYRLLGPMAVYDVVLETPCAPEVVVRALTIMLEERRQRPA
jgi:DNA-binding response OmpR family regulator